MNPIQEYQESLGIKKIGIAIACKMPGKHIQYFKQFNFKKINIVHKAPTHGNLKHTRHWLLVFKFQGLFYVGKITEYANQQFWSDLDMGMPVQDMDRGMINLKLGRCLLNLRDDRSSTVWDPLGGVGRNLVAGLDLINRFWISDLDSKCESQAKQNLDFAKDFYSQKNIHIESDLQGIFTHNITHRLPANLEQKIGSETNLSVVTEGYLGHNLAKNYTSKIFQTQLVEIETMWNQALRYWQELKIAEVIFCLPQLLKNNHQNIKPDLSKILAGTRYLNTDLLDGGKDIVYSRKTTVIGHRVIKLKLGD
jgi:hypothetical protein